MKKRDGGWEYKPMTQKEAAKKQKEYKEVKKSIKIGKLKLYSCEGD